MDDWLKLLVSTVFSLAIMCLATFDINPKQLQMVADHLTLQECRKLSESLHEGGFSRSHDPSGKSEPKGISCLRLLEYWNTHEGNSQSFHQLALRLRQLDRNDIADKLAKSVSDEKISEVRESFLSDPFKARIHTNSPLLQESSQVQPPPPPPHVEDNSWTAFEIFIVAFLVLIGIVFVFISVTVLFRIFIPDSFARMRTSLYLSFTGERPGDEELFFIM